MLPPRHSVTTPIRILRIITRMNIGGPAVHVALLSTTLDREQFSTCLVVGEPDPTEGDLRELVRGDGVRVIRLTALQRAIRPWADAVALWQLLRIVWREHPQIIHTHMAKAGTLGRLAGLLYNVVGPGRRPPARALLVHTFHGHVLDGYFPSHITRFFITIERWLARRTDSLIAVSATVRDELLKKRIGHREQWHVIPLGLDLTRLVQLPSPERSSSVRVGLVARLVPIKNPSLLLEALCQLQHRGAGPVVTAVFVGDGPLRHDLERRVEALGLDKVVTFAGWQRDIRSVYESLDIVCLTSRNEGTPLALIEAMAAGRAVVGTAVGGVRDLLGEPQETSVEMARGQFALCPRGILVMPEDAEGLAAALDALAGDASLRNTLGEAGRRYVTSTFSHGRLLRDMADLYMAWSHLPPVEANAAGPLVEVQPNNVGV